METWPAVRGGLHFLLPVGVLIWCLMVEEMSPSLAAFWSIVMLVVLMTTQRPLLAFFRGTPSPGAWRTGWSELIAGLNDGARNMIGIGVATATAGIIVGAITLTGLALRMTEFVEFVSNGNVMVMLLFIMLSCLVLGLGVPTTANYVLVATLMAPIVVELGAQSGLVIPLIAVHLFVFYYGIMGDITPPVGLATFAAVAISGEDMIATGIQGSLYALRTVILPFIWIFNPQLLLIDVHGGWELALIVTASIVAMMMFAAVTMNWFRIRCRWWENLLLLGAVTLLFRPDFFMDFLAPEYVAAPPARIYDIVRDTPSGDRLVLVIKGSTIEGNDVTKTIADGRKRLADSGLTLAPVGDRVQISGVKFGSRARKSGFEQGWDVARVDVPSDRPTPHWFYLPALVLIALVWWSQGRRMHPALAVA
jgi:TRAP transporter 4TM/12TM fusion protein